jgi:hypothetical protein
MSGSLTIHRYECKGGSIVATQVTASNFAEIADWTGGATHPHTRAHVTSVSIPPYASLAIATDWVVRMPDGRFVVLTDMDFNDRYQRAG